MKDVVTKIIKDHGTQDMRHCYILYGSDAANKLSFTSDPVYPSYLVNFVKYMPLSSINYKSQTDYSHLIELMKPWVLKLSFWGFYCLLLTVAEVHKIFYHMLYIHVTNHEANFLLHPFFQLHLHLKKVSVIEFK